MNRSGQLKTYSHLQGSKKVPSAYEIATTQLLYYPKQGIETDLPLNEWYRKYQKGSLLTSIDWEQFNDPRQTTYTTYVHLQKEQETFFEGLLNNLNPTPLEKLEEIIPVLRFPYHGLQMIAAYVAQMAPSGKLTVASLFQSADELRRVHGFAHLMVHYRKHNPLWGDSSPHDWVEKPQWQPLRKLIEELLITYDWGEALVALNLCVKPVIDHTFLSKLADQVRTAGDPLLATALDSLYSDSKWHFQWAETALKLAAPEALSAVESWKTNWNPKAIKAMQPFEAVFR